MKIRFLLGKEMVFKNIQAGSTIIVKEDTSFFASLYQLPGDFYRFFEQTKNQIYLFVILLSHLILFFGLWIGLNKINWSPKLTLTFAILNISLFWISLYFASFSTILFTKFLIPLLLTLLVTFIPLLLFFWVIKTNKKNSVKNDENLLRLVMLFSHGEWALRNLNSILLLCENSPSNWTDNSDFNDKLMQRLKTFSEMTLQSLNEIIESERTSNYQSEGYDTIKDSIKEVNCLIKNIAEEHSLQKLIDNFTMIRNYTKEVRTNIYSRFSCNPVEVINNITENFKPRLEENNISLTKTKMFDDKIPVLIKNYQLGDILDNMFQNSITLLKNSKVKNISIKLYKESPKIIIKFSNSGPQIDFNKWNKIFEQGYSESRSTGLGLFLASETTKKYGGRVFVQSSDKDSTSFIIELNEGIIKSK
jgi:signal transduction histidine kinase